MSEVDFIHLVYYFHEEQMINGIEIEEIRVAIFIKEVTFKQVLEMHNRCGVLYIFREVSIIYREGALAHKNCVGARNS